MSWILIFGMVVALSFLLYNWSIEQATSRTEELSKRTDPLTCQEIGISVDGACQTSTTIIMNISNVETYDVEGFIFRSIGIYPDLVDYLDSTIIYIELFPGETEHLILLKKGSLSQIELVPIVTKNNKNIYCEEQTVVKEVGELKIC